MPIKHININIQGEKHLDLAFSFLEKEQPDTVAIQEILERDVPKFKKQFGYQTFYVRFCDSSSSAILHNPSETSVPSGVAILSKHPFLFTNSERYANEDKDNERLNQGMVLMHRDLLSAGMMIGGERYVLATTHFTWAPDGKNSEHQKRHLRTLVRVLEHIGPCVLTGDFNAARGLEIFNKLAHLMKDNIPSNVTTTLDQNLHRTPGLQLVVDGYFSKFPYIVSDVQVVDGVSDHCAIVGTISIDRWVTQTN